MDLDQYNRHYANSENSNLMRIQIHHFRSPSSNYPSVRHRHFGLPFHHSRMKGLTLAISWKIDLEEITPQLHLGTDQAVEPHKVKISVSLNGPKIEDDTLKRLAVFYRALEFGKTQLRTSRELKFISIHPYTESNLPFRLATYRRRENDAQFNRVYPQKRHT
jgi:hypothetical protein